MSRRKREMKPDRSPAVEVMLTVEFPELKGAELTQAITLRRIFCKMARDKNLSLPFDAQGETSGALLP